MSNLTSNGKTNNQSSSLTLGYEKELQKETELLSPHTKLYLAFSISRQQQSHSNLAFMLILDRICVYIG